HGLDPNTIMMKLAREYVSRTWRHAAAAALDLWQAAALHLAITNASVEYGTCSMLFRPLPDEQALSALHAAIRWAWRGAGGERFAAKPVCEDRDLPVDGVCGAGGQA